MLPKSPLLLRALPLFISAIALASLSTAKAQLPSFPGALGFGATATGASRVSGHTPTVYHVTNLNDSGTGSFRDAVSGSYRMIVFDVGGYINLSSAVSVSSNITIAGQTAPGQGIAISGAEVGMANTNNIICRFIRMRPGSPSSSSDDCISFYDAANIIADHCSFEFAKWNNIDAVATATQAITVQNSIIADPIGQQFGAHTEAVGGNFSWFNNLFVNGHNRQPLAKTNTIYINNVLYNFSAGYTTHTGTRFKHDIINNYFICGPASSSGGNAFFQIDTNQSMYYTGNLLDTDKNSVLNGSTLNPYPGYDGTGTILTSPWSPITTAILASSNPPLSTANAVPYDVSVAGTLPHDDMDTLICNQVNTLGNAPTGTGTGSAGPSGGLYTSQAQTGLSNNGFGTVTGGVAPIDSDQDGMPDDWEYAMGLNPNSAADSPLIAASGYTNLEDYLNWAALPHTYAAKNTAAVPSSVDIDLSIYTDGFPATANFTVSNVSGGAVTQSGSGGYLVHFVPTVNTSGTAGFSFAVSNGSYTMTSPFGVLVSPNALPKTLLWIGDSSTNIWNTSALNFINQSTNTGAAFSGGDRVTFDDSGSNSPAINISAALSPSYVGFNADTKNYTLSGTGYLAGTMALVKDGNSTLTVSTNNAFTGGVNIQGGAITITSGGSIGTGPVTFQDATSITSAYAATSSFTLGNTLTVPAGGTGTLNMSARMKIGGGSGGGTLNVNIPGTTPAYDSLYGAWSTFTGTLNLTGSVTGANIDATFNGGAFDGGLGGATVNLNNISIVTHNNSGGNTFNIGALNGTATSSLGGVEYAGPITYVVGALGTNSTFAGSMTNGASTLSLTKTGGGTFVLTGTSNYTGATTVSGGKIVIDGTLGNTPMTIASGVTLGGAGVTTGTVTIASGGKVSPGSAGGTPGTFTAVNGFYSTAPTFTFDLSNSPTGVNDKISTSGTLSMTGSNTVKINFTNGVLGAGTYSLIESSTTLVVSSYSAGLTTPSPTGARQSYALIRPSSGTSPGYLRLTVTGNAADLTWSGSNGGVWDLSTTEAWNSTATTGDAHWFYNFDTANFDDTATSGTVTLVGSVQPRILNVSNNTLPYVITGSGTIDGTTKLVKTGTGTLTIANTGTNTFSGGTTLSSGVLAISAPNSGLGTGVVSISGGTLQILNGISLPNSLLFSGTSAVASNASGGTIVSSTANTFTSSGTALVNMSGVTGILTIAGDMSGFTGTVAMGTGSGFLRLNGGTNSNFGSSNTLFDLGSGSATLANRNGGVTVNLGAVQGGPSTTLQGRQSTSGSTSTTYVVGALNTDAIFGGHIATGGDLSGMNITKIGSGNWTLSGVSNFTGDLNIQQGTVTVSGSLTNVGNFEAAAGATLSLSGGTITNDVQIDADATFTGCGTINGNMSCQGTLLVNCGGSLIVTGSLQNDGTMRITNGSSLVVSGQFINTGLLDIITGSQTLPANFINTGIVVDSSTTEIQSYSKSGSTFTVSIASYDGHNYQLKATNSLASPVTWSNVGAAQAGATNSDGSGSTLSFTDNSAGGSARFYQIVVSP